MGWLKDTLRRAAPLVSRRHRSWQNLLSSLDYDPARAERFEPLNKRDFIICGCPRTGTSLLTAQLFQPPRLITVLEPWDGLRMSPVELFEGLRAEIDDGELRRGRLDVDALQSQGIVQWCPDGANPSRVAARSDYLLGVKWPAFWRYIGLLPATRFLVCVRDPAETIASFKAKGGRLAKGLDYDAAFNREMNEELAALTSDVEMRRVLLYEYITSRILNELDRPNVMVIRYERWLEEPDRLRSEISGFLETELASWPVHIARAASGSSRLSERELMLIRDHCHSARALAYT